MSDDNSKLTVEDFNRLDKLVRIDDPRMNNIQDKDIIFERDKNESDRLKFLRNGVEAKFLIVFDGLNWVFRPLSIQEEHDCEIKASDDLFTLKEHQRTEAYRQYRIIIHKLSTALSSCQEDANLKLLNKNHLLSLPSSYIYGLYRKYEELEAELNTDLDKITQDQLDELVELIVKSPKLVSSCTHKQLQLVVLELLRINSILVGN